MTPELKHAADQVCDHTGPCYVLVHPALFATWFHDPDSKTLIVPDPSGVGATLCGAPVVNSPRGPRDAWVVRSGTPPGEFFSGCRTVGELIKCLGALDRDTPLRPQLISQVLPRGGFEMIIHIEDET